MKVVKRPRHGKVPADKAVKCPRCDGMTEPGDSGTRRCVDCATEVAVEVVEVESADSVARLQAACQKLLDIMDAEPACDIYQALKLQAREAIAAVKGGVA